MLQIEGLATAYGKIEALKGVSLSAQAGQDGPKGSTTDPRFGLKPGVTDAGTAAKNMVLLSSLSKPKGFFDPKNPLGDPIPAERPAGEAAPAAAAPSAADELIGAVAPLAAFAIGAKLGHMFESGGDAGQIAHTITVAVLVGARIDLVDDAAAPPFVVGCFCLWFRHGGHPLTAPAVSPETIFF